MISFAYIVIAQLLIFQAVYSQCVNRIVQGPNGPIELLPNQILVPQGRPVLLPGPNPPCKPSPVVSTPSIPEYNIGLSPVLTNIPPPNLQGNIIVPNVQSAISNTYPGNVFVPNLAPGNVIVPSGNMVGPSGNIVVPSGNMVVPNQAGLLPLTESYAPNVIHDNSVANSLANALQLLVVSNLLSSTLPEPYNPSCYDRYMPGYNYIY